MALETHLFFLEEEEMSLKWRRCRRAEGVASRPGQRATGGRARWPDFPLSERATLFASSAKLFTRRAFGPQMHRDATAI